MKKKEIDERVNRVLLAYQYQDGVDLYVDAVRLARFFGFNVTETDHLSAEEDGCITVSANGEEKSIVVNDSRSFEFKRFIIVHELAHYLLHYDRQEELFKHRENIKGKSLEENDADYMAACLLMPPKSFKAQYENIRKGKKQRDEIVMELKNRFRTPVESIIRRIGEVC